MAAGEMAAGEAAKTIVGVAFEGEALSSAFCRSSNKKWLSLL